jgi:glycosyltransferase involved in cell wall biosynthesis
MPVYNEAEYLPEALDSILAQNFTDFRLVIYDNASSDTTADIALRYAARDRRITVVQRPQNIGAWANFQAGIRECASPYFQWCAADDRWGAGFLEQAVQQLDNDPGIGLVFCHYHVFTFGDNKRGALHRPIPGTSDRKRVNFAIRIADPVPSLYYGLYRREIAALQLSIEKPFDFVDLYLGQEIAAQHKIAVLTTPMYLAGIKGLSYQAKPMNGRKIRHWPYVRHTTAQILRHFPSPFGLCVALYVAIRALRQSMHRT